MTITADLMPTAATGRNTRGRVPIGRIMLNGQDLTIQVSELSLSFSDSAHDSVTLKAQSTTLEDLDGMVDSTISFYWGSAPHTEPFSGYIVDAEKNQVTQGALSFTLSILGTTKVMYEGFPRFWTDKTIPHAVRDLSYKNLLGFVGHEHPYVWQVLAQTEESDWTIANRLTQRLGWMLFNRYGVLLCYDPLRLFTESGIYTRLVLGSEVSPDTDRYLIDFTPTERAEVIQESLGTKYGYFTSGGKEQVATSPGSYRGYIFDTSKVIRDQDEADVYVAAGDLETSNWKQHAVARMWGDADIYPGMCVEVLTTNRRYVKDKFDGKWLVRNAVHRLNRQQYQTMLYLCRPDSSSGVHDAAFTPFWQDGSGRAKPVLTLEQPTQAGQSGTETPGIWASSWADRTYRSVL